MSEIQISPRPKHDIAQALAPPAVTTVRADVPSAPVAAPATPPLASEGPSPGTDGQFKWPPSTRLLYSVEWRRGNQTTPGSAVLEWRQDGRRYEIDLTAQSASSLVWTLSSRGRLSDNGLVPEQFLRSVGASANSTMPPTNEAVDFDVASLRLANGTVVPRLHDVQDPASQLIETLYTFGSNPQWLAPGRTIDMPTATPGHQGRWQLDPQAPETLSTPFGPLAVVRLEGHVVGDWGTDLPAKMWLAPSLGYFPGRMVWSLANGETLDLTLAELPLQAVASASGL